MRILLCSLYKYPDGDAGAIRQEKLALMAQTLGNEVFVVGLGKATGNTWLTHHGIPYISLRRGASEYMNKVLSHVLYWKHLKKMIRKYEPQVIIMDDLGLLKTIQIKEFCRKAKIKLVHDSVEWYSPEQFRHGQLSWGYIKKDILNRYLIDRDCSVIAISKYLQNHFQSKGIPCVRIPIVVSDKDLHGDKHLCGNKTVFTYAGQPGKKDYLFAMLDAFMLLRAEVLENVEFHIVGCTEQQMIAAGIKEEVIEHLRKHLVIHGRVSHDEVLEILKITDFTMLVRNPELRYAKAGFPTKVVESLANATPVLCNISSDLGICLTDGENAVIAKSHAPEALAEALQRAIALPAEGRLQMQSDALASAKRLFDYHLYLDDFEKILNM